MEQVFGHKGKVIEQTRTVNEQLRTVPNNSEQARKIYDRSSRCVKNTMTTFPYQYAPMSSTHTALPGIDSPLTTTTTSTPTTSSTTNTSIDISSNVSSLIDSLKNFDTTTLIMIGGSIVMIFIIFK